MPMAVPQRAEGSRRRIFISWTCAMTALLLALAAASFTAAVLATVAEMNVSADAVHARPPSYTLRSRSPAARLAARLRGLWKGIWQRDRAASREWEHGVTRGPRWKLWRLLNRAEKRHREAPEREALLSQLRAEVSAKGGLHARAAAVGHPLDDLALLRFLEVVYWRIEVNGVRLADSVEETIAWRESFIPELYRHEAEIRRESESGSLYVGGTDREGRPIIHYRPARRNSQGEAAATRHLIYTVERALAEMPDNGSGNGGSSVTTFGVLVDCKGVGFSNLPPLGAMKRSFGLLQRHYPMRLGYVRILNAGGLSAFWRLLSAVLAERTRNKIDFLAERGAERALLKLVAPEQLETRLGGKSDFVYDNERYFS